MRKGDIILVPFPFTDLSGNKYRPALVLIESDFEVTVCFITTQIRWKEIYDVVVPPTGDNGLKKESLIRLSKFATIDKDLVWGRIGTLEDKHIRQININLAEILQLNK
ncbi:type II toxin-antitoxin system PemK/MazF family toxin [Mariniphaga sp.]|uniref:type II toxin-antitoxin system PemK/MazF family toxin n=1 Tax=Mariniphaga sp. TaxID=1954475 RepID=UPI003568CE65